MNWKFPITKTLRVHTYHKIVGNTFSTKKDRFTDWDMVLVEYIRKYQKEMTFEESGKWQVWCLKYCCVMCSKSNLFWWCRWYEQFFAILMRITRCFCRPACPLDCMIKITLERLLSNEVHNSYLDLPWYPMLGKIPSKWKLFW